MRKNVPPVRQQKRESAKSVQKQGSSGKSAHQGSNWAKDRNSTGQRTSSGIRLASVFDRRNASTMSPITESIGFSQKQGQILQVHKQKLEESHQLMDKLKAQLSTTQKRMSVLQSEKARDKFLFEKTKKQDEAKFKDTLEGLKASLEVVKKSSDKTIKTLKFQHNESYGMVADLTKKLSEKQSGILYNTQQHTTFNMCVTCVLYLKPEV